MSSRRLCIAVCENLLPEAAFLLKEQEDVDLVAYPANCGRPPICFEDFSPALPVKDTKYSRILIFGGHCVAALGKTFPEWHHCQSRIFSHCFEPLLHKALLDDFLQKGAYLLTPGWLRNWRDRIRKWGFDQDTARSFFRESATGLILLDTMGEKHSSCSLKEFADFVSLPWQILPVGLDLMKLTLSNAILEWRSDEEKQTTEQALAQERRKLADYAVIFDLIGSLAREKSEAKVIDSISQFFFMLFAPMRLNYLKLEEGLPAGVYCYPLHRDDREQVIDRLCRLKENYSWTDSQEGFLLRISDAEGTLGILEVEGIAFPQYRTHYLNLAITVSKVCALALENARTYEKLEKTLEDLQAAHGRLKVLRGLIPICSSCKKIRDVQGFWNQIESYIRDHSEAEFSHGICPECIKKLYPEFTR